MATSNMKLDQFMYTEARWPVVMVYQLTSPRTIQAFLVLLFGITVIALTLQGQEVPDVLTWVLIAIVSFFFGDTRESAVLTGLRNGVAGQVTSVAASQAAAKVASTSPDAGVANGDPPEKE